VRAARLTRPGADRPTQNPAAVLRQRAEQAAATLPPLLVAAERIAATVLQGVHGRRRVGQGETFWQFRVYQPGDPIQSIDWRQTAKGDRAYVRENEWEAAQSIWLWCDGSPSMDYRSERNLPTKRERAAVLSLALASLLTRAGELVGALARDPSLLRPGAGRAVMNRLAVAFALPATPGAPSLPAVDPLPRHSRLAMVGDLLSPVGEIERIVRGYAARGVRGALVQVLDPAEVALPFAGRVRFQSLEGEADVLIGRVETVRDEYLRLMEAHRAALADVARQAGWAFITHRTDQPPQAALLGLHQALAQSPRQ
jgi:uncharacterized protein (DUF58 family)